MVNVKVVLGLVACSAFAQVPVASVRSPAPFQLRGVTVPVAGVPSWPVMSGDSVATLSESAWVVFADGSKVMLAPHSKATLTMKAKIPALRLDTGAASYALASGSTLSLSTLDRNAVLTDAGKPGTTARDFIGRPPPPPPALSVR